MAKKKSGKKKSSPALKGAGKPATKLAKKSKPKKIKRPPFGMVADGKGGATLKVGAFELPSNEMVENFVRTMPYREGLDDLLNALVPEPDKGRVRELAGIALEGAGTGANLKARTELVARWAARHGWNVNVDGSGAVRVNRRL